MAEETQPECQLRRRRSSGPNLPLNLEVGYQVTEGGPSCGTPSPCGVKFAADDKEPSSSSALINFRKKQQSFDIQEDLDDCEEEEIIIEDSDGENEETADRPLTPMPLADFGANTTYSVVPQSMEFIKVQTLQNDCPTDVSDVESQEDEN